MNYNRPRPRVAFGSVDARPSLILSESISPRALFIRGRALHLFSPVIDRRQRARHACTVCVCARARATITWNGTGHLAIKLICFVLGGWMCVQGRAAKAAREGTLRSSLPCKGYFIRRRARLPLSAKCVKAKEMTL